VIFSYLDSKNVFKRYQEAKRYTDTLTVPFPEFERIAANQPFEGIDPNYPNTTDGTTASIIRKTPRRVIQQLPTGKVESDDDDWLGVVADFIFTNKILPYANEEYDLIQKCWTAVEDALTFGSCVTYTPFLNHDGYFCPDVTNLYWGDIAIQPGKKSIYSCSYFFMRSWWQKEDIEALIDRETKLAASAKKRGEKYDSSWDLQALAQVKDAMTNKDQQARTPVENDRGVDATGIELITGFQKGVGAKFYTFASKGNIIVRTETNEDPRGKYPIDTMYGDIDGTNPLGRGIVELVGPLQNLIDSDMQMYQYNRALMLAPPVIVTGNVSSSKIKLVPNAVIKIASNDGQVVPLKIDTSAVINYPSLYGLQKSQLLNLVSSPDTSISSDIGNPGFSKTPAGINQQKANISVDDNYVRKMFEAWFENWAETAINLYFAKRSGVEELQLDEDSVEALKNLAKEGKFDLTQLSEDGLIRIDYDTATPALKFRVDASTSKMKDDQEQLAALTGLLTTLEQNPVLQSIIPADKIAEVWNKIVDASGVEDPEDISVDLEELKQQQAQQTQMQGQMQSQGQAQPTGGTPSESITFKDAVAAGATDAAATMLEQAGLPGDGIRQQAAINQTAQLQPANQAAAQPAQPAQVPQPAAPAPQEPPLVQHLRQLGMNDQTIQQVVHHVVNQAGAPNVG
jgi:hypothetical protein